MKIANFKFNDSNRMVLIKGKLFLFSFMSFVKAFEYVNAESNKDLIALILFGLMTLISIYDYIEYKKEKKLNEI